MNAHKYLLTLPATLTSLSIAHELDPPRYTEEIFCDELEIESLFKHKIDLIE